ncbi:type II secretion system F family protein [Novosphingobium sp.]|uniref:type II secretion system F family protein n=1 Tax=Novosphingobium sp. TaxID=1874826 RepID=UPI0033424D8E
MNAGLAPALRASVAGAWRYRAVRPDGSQVAGEIEALDQGDAIARIRRTGAVPLDLRAIDGGAASPAQKSRRQPRAISRALIGELAVLLGAGLPLDRALALAIDNIENPAAAQAMGALLIAVREGAPLSRAMLDNPSLFTPAEAAMAEAGEAGGKLAEALERLSEMLEQEAELQRILITSMIYPVALLIIATGVIGLMLIYVVPQFEHLLDNSRAQLPAATMAVIGASRLLREDGIYALVVLVALGFGLRQAAARPGVRAAIDVQVLRLPLLGELLRRIDTARFAHTLGALVDGGVPLPTALVLAQRVIANSVIAAAIGKVAEGLREGGGLAGPLAATKVLPRLALAFVRTGEETSELALMLRRLAVVLDRDVRTRLERLVAILTPTITVVLGAVVATIIASIMSAILGFNDLAVSP